METWGEAEGFGINLIPESEVVQATRPEDFGSVPRLWNRLLRGVRLVPGEFARLEPD
ncbi:hypothetical protein GGI1_23326 [Acidithiobacillus sp. GGI-221]|nr:hypothetical protein GGI1_23326 [Acidithiobacillus sp. GGI-221]